MNYETLKQEAQKYKDSMNNSERMAAYMKGEEVDRIPFSTMTSEAQAGLYGYKLKEYRQSAQVQIDVTKRYAEEFQVGEVTASMPLGLHGIGHALGSVMASPDDSFEYISDHMLKDYDMLDGLELDLENNPALQKYIKIADEIREYTDNKCSVTVGISGPMSTAFATRKPELFLRDMARDKENAHRLLQFVVDCNLDWVRYCKERYGSIIVSIADPCTASNLLGKKMFLEFSEPYLRKQLQEIKNITGAMPSVHICGRTRPLWASLKDMGVTSFSVDNCEDLEELKATIGDAVMISGNVPPVDVLRNGTIDDVISAVQKCLKKGSDSPSGYMLMPGCQVPKDTPRENILAFTYAARRYGRGAKKGQPCRGLVEEGLL